MKKNIRKKMRNYQGITLMALVITVIVLLILAGVSIGLVFNSDGLFNKASDSAKRYNQKKAQEALTLILSNATMKKYSPEGLTNEELDNMIKDIGGIIDPENPNKITVDGYDFEIDRDKLEVTDSLGENSNITPGGGGSGGGNQGSGEGNKKEESTLTLSATGGTIVYPNDGIFTILENTSNGELSVSSSDDSIASASINGNQVTIIPKIITESEKEAIITVKSAETEKYKEQTAIYIATIKKGGITINAVPNVREYDETAFDALLSVTVTPEDALVEYSLNEGAYQSEIPQITEAGQYTITIKASKDGYVTKEESITVTVSKQSSTTGNLVLSETSGTITYPNTKIVNVTNNASNGTLSVSSSNPNVATASVSNNQITITPQAITSSGQTSTITVTSASTSNYEAQTATYTVTVNQGTISISATGYSGTYDGSSHNAVSNIVVSPSDATKTYSLNNGSYSSTIPTVTSVGTYTVKIKATKVGYVNNEMEKTVIVKGGVEKHIKLATGKKLVNVRDVYGKDVLGYTCSKTDVNWQILYIDEEDDSRVYLISKDYVVPTITGIIKATNSNYNKIYYFDEAILKEYNGLIPKTEFTNKFLSEYSGKNTTTKSLQATNFMLDQNAWRDYGNSKFSEFVYGGATLPLFISSYNDLRTPETLLKFKEDGDGYRITEDGEVWAPDLKNYRSGLAFSYESSASFLFEQTQSGALWTYLVAPAADYGGDRFLVAQYSSSINSDVISKTHGRAGFRPVVSLRKDVLFIENTNGTYSVSI